MSGMSTARVLVLVGLVSLALVVAIGAGRASYEVNGVEVTCPDNVWSSAVDGLADDVADPGYACTVESQQRLFAVAGGLMGLVMISGLLSRRR